MIKRTLLFAVLASALAFTSCDKEDDMQLAPAAAVQQDNGNGDDGPVDENPEPINNEITAE